MLLFQDAAKEIADLKDVLSGIAIGLTIFFGIITIYQKISDKRIALRK